MTFARIAGVYFVSSFRFVMYWASIDLCECQAEFDNITKITEAIVYSCHLEKKYANYLEQIIYITKEKSVGLPRTKKRIETME